MKKRYYVSLCELEEFYESAEGGYTMQIPKYTTEFFKNRKKMEGFFSEAVSYYGGHIGDGWRILSGKGKSPKNRHYFGYS